MGFPGRRQEGEPAFARMLLRGKQSQPGIAQFSRAFCASRWAATVGGVCFLNVKGKM
jgi:hypothetical protein